MIWNITVMSTKLVVVLNNAPRSYANANHSSTMLRAFQQQCITNLSRHTCQYLQVIYSAQENRKATEHDALNKYIHHYYKNINMLQIKHAPQKQQTYDEQKSHITSHLHIKSTIKYNIWVFYMKEYIKTSWYLKNKLAFHFINTRYEDTYKWRYI
jgi:hypothetical protein